MLQCDNATKLLFFVSFATFFTEIKTYKSKRKKVSVFKYERFHLIIFILIPFISAIIKYICN